jgi:hypothetical protein
MQTYTKQLHSSRQLRLIHDGSLAAKVLGRACDEIQQHPQSLPLWAFRCAQWVNRGRLGYRETWKRLEDAAMSTGAKEAWVDRCLYNGFALSNAFKTAPPELAGGRR